VIQRHHFMHHGHAFTIEAEGWPTEDAACAAIIDLQIWAMQFSQHQTAELHRALRQETEALLYETSFDPDTAPLPEVRDAQRRAVTAALQGMTGTVIEPTVTIEAQQISVA
jgi:hypothetical protein